LTRTRLQFEARALARAQRAGVVVPRVLWVDEPAGVLAMERVEGWSVREVLGGGAEGETEVEDYDEVEQEAGAQSPEDVAAAARAQELEGESEGMRALRRLGVEGGLMASVGAALARLHVTGIIHGDLTTSNMMVRLTPNAQSPYEIVSSSVRRCSQ
jgi:TP53 regulating kinase-like protein